MLNILYVDDESALLDVGKLYLESVGEYNVDIYSSALEGLAALNSVNYDVIISDYQMPEMDGIEFLKKVRASGNDIPFIIFTGRGREDVVIDAINNGADFYLQKGGDVKSQFAELMHKIGIAVERKKSEKALIESEERYRNVVEVQTEFISRFYPDGTHIFVNDAYCRYFNLQREDIIGNKFIPKIPEEDQEIVREHFDSLTRENPMAVVTHRIIMPDGNVRWQWWNDRAIFNDQDKIIEYQSVGRDVTEMKLAEEALKHKSDEIEEAAKLLQENEKKYKDFFKTSRDFVFITSLDGHLLNMNDAAIDFLGYSSREEMLETSVYEFYADPSKRDEHVRVIMEQGYSKEFPVVLKKKDGTRIQTLITAVIRKDDEGNSIGVQGTIRDVTKYYQTLDELSRKNEELAAVNEELVTTEEEIRNYIKEINQKNKELGESEERYRNIVEVQTEFISRFYPDGTHIFVNDAYCRYFNLQREDIIGNKFIPEIPKEDQEIVREHFESLNPENPTATIVHRIIMPEGGIRWQRWSDRAIFNDQDKIIEYQSVGRDVSEMKMAEDALMESEERLRSLFSSMQEGFVHNEIICNADGKPVDSSFIEINPSFEHFTGLKRDEILGRTVLEVLPEVDKIWIERCGKTALTGETQFFEHYISNKDKYFEISVYCPRIGEFASLFSDVTEKKRVEEVILSNSLEWQRTFDASNDAMWILDKDQFVLQSNKTAGTLFSCSYKEMIGRHCWEIVHNSDGPIPECPLLRARKSLKREKMELRIANRWYEVTVDPFLDEEGGYDGSIHIISDITNRKYVEEALHQANRKLNLMASITRHDINNKVMGILGYLAIAEMKFQDPDLVEYVRKIESMVNEIQNQIKWTKVYQDIGSQEPKWQDLETIISKFNTNMMINLNIDLQGVCVYADPMLENVLFNLLDNSVRHGEHVSEIRISSQESDEGLMIVWEDNGVGIPYDKKEQIFDRDYGENTGLGLFLVREILLLTGIRIKEAGELGKGARFEIMVPEEAYKIKVSSDMNL